MPRRFCPKCAELGNPNDWVTHCKYCGTQLKDVEVPLSREEYGLFIKDNNKCIDFINEQIAPDKVDMEAVQHRLDIKSGRIKNTLPNPNKPPKEKNILWRIIDALPYNDTQQRKSTTGSSVHCPYCGSGNVKKIGVGGRVVSTAAFGLASSKIGKQWHCKKCGSDF